MPRPLAGARAASERWRSSRWRRCCGRRALAAGVARRAVSAAAGQRATSSTSAAARPCRGPPSASMRSSPTCTGFGRSSTSAGPGAPQERDKTLRAAVPAARSDHDARPALQHRVPLRRDLPVRAATRRARPDRPGHRAAREGPGGRPDEVAVRAGRGFRPLLVPAGLQGGGRVVRRAARIGRAVVAASRWRPRRWPRAATGSRRGSCGGSSTRRPTTLGAEQRAAEARATRCAGRDRRAGRAWSAATRSSAAGFPRSGANWSPIGLARAASHSTRPARLTCSKPDAPGGVALSERRASPVAASVHEEGGPDIMTMPWLVALAGLLGLAVGSFLNVCIYRLPLEQSLAFPASHCTSCNRKLSWFENVPVLAWLVLRGRCRTCHASISVVYPLVEALHRRDVRPGGVALRARAGCWSRACCSAACSSSCSSSISGTGSCRT